MADTYLDDSNKFDKTCTQLNGLLLGKIERDSQKIHSLFDDLNSLNFKQNIVTNTQKAVLLINQCCTVVPSNDTLLVAKCCQLIHNLISKQNVRLEGQTRSLAIGWCVSSLKHCADIAVLDILSALEIILKNGFSEHEIREFFNADGEIMSLLRTDARKRKFQLVSIWDIQLLVLKCFEAVTNELKAIYLKLGVQHVNRTYLFSCSEIFLGVLKTPKYVEQNEIMFCKLVVTCLRGLGNVIQMSEELKLQLLGDCLGFARAYMLYGLEKSTDLKIEKIFPTYLGNASFNSVSAEIVGNKGQKGKTFSRKKINKKTEHGKKINFAEEKLSSSFSSFSVEEKYKKLPMLDSSVHSNIKLASDSDFSDSESGQVRKAQIAQTKVRLDALTFLRIIIKITERKVLFGYYSTFLPDGPDFPKRQHLLTCLNDPSAYCRMEALLALFEMLVGSRIYFLQAEYIDKPPASFTPFSITLGYLLSELHVQLCHILTLERYIPAIVQVLKCIAALVQNTPYFRLKKGLISTVVNNVKLIMNTRDWDVQVGVLTVFGSILSVNPMVDEIIPALLSVSVKKENMEQTPIECQIDTDQKEDSESDTEELEEFDPINTEYNLKCPWLLEICMSYLGIRIKDKMFVKTVGKFRHTVRIESLQVLDVLAKHYFKLVVLKHFELVLKCLEISVCDTETSVCLHTTKVIETIGVTLQELPPGDDVDDEKVVALHSWTKFWKFLLSGPLVHIIQNFNDVKSVGCDCLASIGSDVFLQLTKAQQILVITLLFGCASGEENNVRASAVRALAMIILIPSQRQDIHFVIDTAEIILKGLHDDSLVVRLKASWSFCNLICAITSNRTDPEAEDISVELLEQLFAGILSTSKDNEKVRSNAMRALGSLLLLLDRTLLQKSQFRSYLTEAIDLLIHNATTGRNMKLRWNACYALGNMMKNEYLFTENLNWQEKVFKSLMDLVQNLYNFKVRTNAALALSTPKLREHYDSYFISVWLALINALENSHNLEDFSEYKHQDNLISQICLTTIHLISLVTEDDLNTLSDTLIFHIDVLHHHMRKFEEATVPEKAGKIAVASSNIMSLLQTPNLSSEQHNAAALLMGILVPDSDKG